MQIPKYHAVKPCNVHKCCSLKSMIIHLNEINLRSNLLKKYVLWNSIKCLFKLKFRIYIYFIMMSLLFCSGQAATWKPELCNTVHCDVPELTISRQYVHLSRRVLPGNTENNKSQKSVQVTLEQMQNYLQNYWQS